MWYNNRTHAQQGRNRKSKDQEKSRTQESKKPLQKPMVQIVPYGTSGSVGIGEGTHLWNKKLCTFKKDDADFFMNRYRKWFYDCLDAEGSVLCAAITALENIVLEHGTVLLGCDQHAGPNHGQIVKEYLEWSVPRRKKKLEADTPADNSPFIS